MSGVFFDSKMEENLKTIEEFRQLARCLEVKHAISADLRIEYAKGLVELAAEFRFYVCKDFIYVSKELAEAFYILYSEENIPAGDELFIDFMTKLIKIDVKAKDSHTINLNIPSSLGNTFPISINNTSQFITLFLYGVIKYKRETQFKDLIHTDGNVRSITNCLMNLTSSQNPILHRALELLFHWLTHNYEDIEASSIPKVFLICIQCWVTEFKATRKFITQIISFLLKTNPHERNVKIYEDFCSNRTWKSPFDLYLESEVLKSLVMYNPVVEKTFDMEHVIEVINQQPFLHWAGYYFKTVMDKITLEQFEQTVYPVIVRFLQTPNDYIQVHVFSQYILTHCFVFATFFDSIQSDMESFTEYGKVCILRTSLERNILKDFEALQEVRKMLQHADPYVSVEAFSFLCTYRTIFKFEKYTWHKYLTEFNFYSEMANCLRQKILAAFECALSDMFEHPEELNVKEADILFIIDSIICAIKAPNVHRNLLGMALCEMFLHILNRNKFQSAFYDTLVQDPEYKIRLKLIFSTLIDSIKNTYGSDETCVSAARLLNNYFMEQMTPDLLKDIENWCLFQLEQHSCRKRDTHLTSCAQTIANYYTRHKLCALELWLVLQQKMSMEHRLLKTARNGRHTSTFYLPGIAMFMNRLLSLERAADVQENDRRQTEKQHFLNELFAFTVRIIIEFLTLHYRVQFVIDETEAKNNRAVLLKAFRQHAEYIHSDNEYQEIEKSIESGDGDAYKNAKEFVEQTLESYSELMTSLIRIDSLCTVSNITTCLTVIKVLMTTSQTKGLIVHCGAHARYCFQAAWMRRSHQFRNVLFNFFDELLLSVKMSTYGPYMVRRNPESRVLLHTIAEALHSDTKYFLNETIRCLIKLLEDNETSNDVKTSALHSLQPLMTDNRMQYSTFCYIQTVCMICLENFSTSEWKLKNAALQTYGGIVTRILGVGRAMDVKTLFSHYPKFCHYFFGKLKSHQSEQECSIAVLMLLSQSFYKTDVYVSRNDTIVYQCYQRVLVSVIKNSSGYLQLNAAKAFVTFCAAAETVQIIVDLAAYVTRNAVNLNVLICCLRILKTLHSQFDASRHKDPQSKRSVDNALRALLARLNGHPHKDLIFALSYINLTSLKDLSDRLDCIGNCTDDDDGDVCNNVYFINYLQAIVYFCDEATFVTMLQRYFLTKYSSTVQCIFLNALVLRHSEAQFRDDACRLLDIVLKFFVASVDGVCVATKSVATQVFFLLAEHTDVGARPAKQTCDEFLSGCRLNDIYESSICCYVSVCFQVQHTDCTVSKLANRYRDAILSADADTRYFAASTLVYLFYACERSLLPQVFQLVFVCFLSCDIDVSHEVCKFVSQVFGTDLCSRYKSCEILFNVEHLLRHMDVYASVQFLCTCFQELCSFTNRLSDDRNIGFDDVIHNKDLVENLLIESFDRSVQFLTKEKCLELLADL